MVEDVESRVHVDISCSPIGERHGNLEVAWDFMYWHIAPMSVICDTTIVSRCAC